MGFRWLSPPPETTKVKKDTIIHSPVCKDLFRAMAPSLTKQTTMDVSTEKKSKKWLKMYHIWMWAPQRFGYRGVEKLTKEKHNAASGVLSLDSQMKTWQHRIMQIHCRAQRYLSWAHQDLAPYAERRVNKYNSLNMTELLFSVLFFLYCSRHSSHSHCISALIFQFTHQGFWHQNSTLLGKRTKPMRFLIKPPELIN